MGGFKQAVGRFFQGRNGVDDLGKFILIVDLIVYFIGILLNSSFLVTLAMMGVIYMFYRMFSKRLWERGEENKTFLKYKKLWRLRYENRKVCKIYLCKSCGRFVRVPKGKGKIEVKCPVCGHREIRRT